MDGVGFLFQSLTDSDYSALLSLKSTGQWNDNAPTELETNIERCVEKRAGEGMAYMNP